MLSLWALSLLLITSHPLAISAFSTLPSPSNKSHRRPYYLLFDSSLLSPDNDGPLLTLFATDDENVNDDKQAADNAPPIPLVYLTENENNQTVDNVPPAPPTLLSSGYKIAFYANIISALILLANIGTINHANIAISSSLPQAAAPSSIDAASKLISTSTRYQINLLSTYTAGSLGYLFLSSGVCNILSTAVNNGRLYTSDTYKRLNVGVLLFGLLGLFSLPGEAGCITSNMNMFGVSLIMIQFTKLITGCVSFIGWEYSVPGGFGKMWNERVKNIMKEVYKGCYDVYKNYPVTEERPATFYRTFWVILTLGNLIFNIPELVFNLQQGGAGSLFSLPVSLSISSIARLGLLSFILYVLKDAAERKRLEGTTFIKLNLMVGMWAFGGEFCLSFIAHTISLSYTQFVTNKIVGIAQGLAADGMSQPFNLRRAADKFLFGLLFLNNGILSVLSKMGVITKRDEVDPDADPPLRLGL